ncbi:MAG TPA: DCC1-like thiol-disulfide oxidoreductase family protein [Chloroflexota bacterium]|nr:DCC1-like thiol-disulfide oxidoreductase family protein [Chloroflexota bacterium]
MRWVRAHDKAGRVLALPNQTPGILQRYGLTRAQVDREAWAIDASGRETAGAAAINRVLAALGGVWALLAATYRLPPVCWIEDRVYRWVARHRHWLSSIYGATPACDEPGIECE